MSADKIYAIGLIEGEYVSTAKSTWRQAADKKQMARRRRRRQTYCQYKPFTWSGLGTAESIVRTRRRRTLCTTKQLYAYAYMQAKKSWQSTKQQTTVKDNRKTLGSSANANTEAEYLIRGMPLHPSATRMC